MRGFTAACLALLLAQPASAHEGPPYPIIVDETVGPYVLSVWADPDVGIGSFFVYLDAPEGAAFPEGTRVEVIVQPLTGRLAEAVHPAERTRRAKGERHVVKLPFDREELWKVRIRVEGASGGGEAEVEVEVTPPGAGPWDLLWFVTPFLAVGFLWCKAVIVRRRVRVEDGP